MIEIFPWHDNITEEMGISFHCRECGTTSQLGDPVEVDDLMITYQNHMTEYHSER